jgi:hypothetical protein
MHLQLQQWRCGKLDTFSFVEKGFSLKNRRLFAVLKIFTALPLLHRFAELGYRDKVFAKHWRAAIVLRKLTKKPTVLS